MNHFEIEEQCIRKERKTTESCKEFNYILFSFLLLAFLSALFLYIFFIREDTVITEFHIEDSIRVESLTDLDSKCEETLCLTRECVTTAARIMQLMDNSKSPCESFYQYACGNYSKVRDVRAGEYIYDPYTEAKDNIVVRIKKMFDDTTGVSQTESFRKARVLYDTCTDKKREENSSLILRDFLTSSGIIWPLLEDDSEPEETTWVHVISEMAKYGFETLFKPKFTAFDNNQTVIIDVDCSVTMLPKEVYLNATDFQHETILQFYEEVLVILLHHLDVKRKSAREMFRNMLHIETQLAQALSEEENAIGDCNRPCERAWCAPCVASSPGEKHPLSEIHKQQLKDIWFDLLKRSSFDLHVRSTCDGNLDTALRVLNYAPKKSVLNYVGWRAVAHLTKYLSLTYQRLYNHYVGKLMKATSVPLNTWRECSEILMQDMGPVIAKALEERNYISVEQRREVAKRFDDTKRAFKSLFQMVPWLPNQTVTEFSEKVDAVQLQIGYPDFLNERSEMDVLYKELEVHSENSFFSNVLKLREFKTRKHFSQLLGEDSNSLNEYSLDRSPLGTEASYDYKNNRVVIDFGLLFNPLMNFGAGLPKYLEYGQNVILAREISHALDTTGIQFDGYGNYRGIDSLPTIVKEKFLSLVTCLSQRYRSSSPNQIDEDIADLGSLFITAANMELHLQTIPPDEIEKELPGITLSKRAIFFVQSSQMFCQIREESTPLSEEKKRSQEERLNMAIANLVTFESAFGCNSDTPMNPIEKCNLLN